MVGEIQDGAFGWEIEGKKYLYGLRAEEYPF
jgi:hypothetical protein